MMRRRSRRSRATWGFADAAALNIPAGSLAGAHAYFWIVPPGRINYLCDTDRVSKVGFRGAHLWLDFNWVGVAAGASLPDVTCYAMKSQQDLAGAPTVVDRNPWSTPETPASLTSWDAAGQEDGTDSFLWTHHIKGSTPPNAGLILTTPSAGNQTFSVGGNASSDNVGFVCRKWFVTQEWQPDVMIRSRRSLTKEDGIAIIFSIDTANPNVGVNVNVRARCLLSRGR